jgi:DNA-binding MarR family transcriptional regulator
MVRLGRAGGGSAAQIASILNSLRRVVRAFRAMAQVAQDVLGISGAQHFVLQRLAEAPALSLNDLAARTMTHKSSVSVVVKRLVDRGLVRRERSTADGRGIVLTLTPEGRRAVERAPQSAQTRMIAALRRFPRRDLETFARLFERFTDELGVGALEPTMLFEDEAGARRDGPRRAVRRTNGGTKTRRGKETRAKGR